MQAAGTASTVSTTSLAHDVPMAGHMGVTRTKDCLLQRYYWPGIFTDTANYCQSCEVCQKSNPKCPIRAKMGSMPLINQPFQRVAMDIVGPYPVLREETSLF